MQEKDKYLPSKSAIQHMRFAFSFFLLPIYLFALSQSPQVIFSNSIVTFIIWHLLVYPASNGYNSYFDRDDSSIALIERPPPVDKSLYYFSILLDAAALILSIIVDWTLFIAVLIYGIFSKLYSHPSVRLKKFPVSSFLVVFIFQGAFIYWSSYASISGLDIFNGWNLNFIIAGLFCSFLIGASYPLTQVYQHKDDGKRGDLTLSILLGIRGSFWFSATLFLISILLLWIYWYRVEAIWSFWLFLLCLFPALIFFFRWFLKVYNDPKQANFKNLSQMTLISSAVMVIYFLILTIERLFPS